MLILKQCNCEVDSQYKSQSVTLYKKKRFFSKVEVEVESPLLVYTFSRILDWLGALQVTEHFVSDWVVTIQFTVFICVFSLTGTKRSLPITLHHIYSDDG
jgi:hypothetical protein